MPVIGRLDGQVDEVLISPISRRREGREPPPARDKGADAPREPQDHAPSQTPPAGESSANRDELPVWLL